MEHRLGLGMVMLLALAASACSKENTVDASTHVESGIGAQCSAKDDPACGVAAVCALGWCRSGCTTDAECPQGALCVGDTPPFGCQLPQDAVCSSAQPCKAPLVCGLDKTCRMPCKVSKDCPRNDQECYAGVCVGDSEKGEAAVSYHSCEDGALRCSGDDPAECGIGPCAVEACNVTAPGWNAAKQCSGDTPFCADNNCVGIHPEDPGPLVQVKSPLGGTYGIDRTEVTWAQYEKFILAKGNDLSGQPPECTNNSSYLPVPLAAWPPMTRPHDPVTFVDWCDANAYCKWAGKRLCGGIGGGANAFGEWADPAKSQWYNACSSGGANNYPYGGGLNEEACNGPQKHVDTTVEVGSCPACQSLVAGYAGVYDLSGNVWEWVDSCEASAGMADTCHVRGGGWGSFDLHCSADFAVQRASGAHDLGFRCCSDP